MSRDTASDETDHQRREERRLAILASYDLASHDPASHDPDGSALDAAMTEELTQYANFAAQLTGAQFAAVNIVGDTYQQSIAGSDGVPLATIDRDDSICGRILYATGPGDVYITSDASQDLTLQSSPWVTSGNVRFYAGAALTGSEGLPLGMLCVVSNEPISDEAARRAAQRLLPVRDSVVAVLEARRKTAGGLVEEPVGTGELTAGLHQRLVTRRGASIDDVIDNGDVQTLFQPIVHLETRTVAGFEALTRGPAGTELESPVALLDAARAVGRLGELDWLCRANAVRVAGQSGLPDELACFINVEPDAHETPCPQHLRPILDQARAGLRIVLEVVDRDPEADVTRLLQATDQARGDAWGVAANDVGAGSAAPALLPFLSPDVVRLDMSLLHQGPSPAAADVAAAVRAYADRTGAVILAEGIEAREHEELAMVFGASYGQGYFYGRPAPLPMSLSAPAHPIPLAQKSAPTSPRATPFEILQETLRPQRGRSDYLLHISTRLQRICESPAEHAVVLAAFDSSEQYHFNQARFDDAAEGNALTICVAPDITARQPHPRYRVGALPWTMRVHAEAALLVITPNYASGLVIRHTGETGGYGTPLVDYIYTQDRSAVIAAARAFLRPAEHAGGYGMTGATA